LTDRAARRPDTQSMSLFESLSGIAVRRLSPARLSALRDRYLDIRHRLAPLMRVAYGTFDARALRMNLDQQVGTDFQVLMVHCSVNNLAPMYTDGPLDLLKMLIDFCGPQRTLVMPAFFFGDPKYSGVRETFTQLPRFDVRRTPSQMGLLSELFRRTKGVVCSRHPVYRVSALGPLAPELVRGHERAETPCGHGTPFDFMTTHDTLILGIGKPFEVLTHVHHAEDVLGEAFPVPATIGAPITMTLVDGIEEIPFTLRSRSLQWQRDMWRLREIMEPSSLREWKFHGVPLFATRAAKVTESIMECAKLGRTLYVQPRP